MRFKKPESTGASPLREMGETAVPPPLLPPMGDDIGIAGQELMLPVDFRCRDRAVLRAARSSVAGGGAGAPPARALRSLPSGLTHEIPWKCTAFGRPSFCSSAGNMRS